MNSAEKNFIHFMFIFCINWLSSCQYTVLSVLLIIPRRPIDSQLKRRKSNVEQTLSRGLCLLLLWHQCYHLHWHKWCDRSGLQFVSYSNRLPDPLRWITLCYLTAVTLCSLWDANIRHYHCEVAGLLSIYVYSMVMTELLRPSINHGCNDRSAAGCLYTI